MNSTLSSRPLTDAARGQLFSCYQMLETLVEVCPDDVWAGEFSGVPFWYQVYHTAYFVDYWFREDSAGAGFPCLRFDPRIPPEFEWDLPEDALISRETMRDYLRVIRAKLERIFTNMTDADLSRHSFAQEAEVTLLDAIFSQTRHIMYNIGYCNGILRARDLQEADWFAYNEPDA
ncbi:MAG: DinB family protein [Eubacteriales bacterium]|nr:DinB family protein [Eubacteriales bacterium]